MIPSKNHRPQLLALVLVATATLGPGCYLVHGPGDAPAGAGRGGGTDDPSGSGDVRRGETAPEPPSCPAGRVEALVASNGDEIGGGAYCVRYEDGQLGCWGNDLALLMGRVSLADARSPRTLIGFDAVTDLALVQGSACGVDRADGRLRCGQVLDGRWPRGFVPARWPVVRGVERPRSVALARIPGRGARGCAVLQDGSLRCWRLPPLPDACGAEGSAGAACLDAITAPIETMPMLLSDEPLRLVVAGPGTIANGFGHHFCALSITGAVVCWGDGRDGQLGAPLSDTVCEPTDTLVGCVVPRVLVRSGAVAVGANESSTCALLPDEEGRPRVVRCWGSFGRFGATWCPDCARGEPQDVTFGRDVERLAVGAEHVCVLLQGGRVRCWGSNRAGQLGDGSFEDRVEPVAVPLDGIREIVAGRLSTCALLEDDRVACWGEGTFGALGRSAPDRCESQGGSSGDDDLGVSFPCDADPEPVEGLCAGRRR